MLLKGEEFKASPAITSPSKVTKKVKIESTPSLIRILVTPVFIVIGLVPLYADGNLLSSVKSGDVDKVYAAATSSPLEVARINYATQLFYFCNHDLYNSN
jgi:hypothetical protein